MEPLLSRALATKVLTGEMTQGHGKDKDVYAAASATASKCFVLSD